MRTKVSYTFAVGIIFASVLLSSAILFNKPQQAYGVCVGVPPCGTPQRIGKPCLCHEGGGVQTGVCGPAVCIAQSYSGGGMPGGGVDAGLKALQGLIGKALEALKGGGGGGMPMPSSASNSFNNEQEKPTTAEDLLKQIANEDTKSPFDVLSDALGAETKDQENAQASSTKVMLIDNVVNNVSDILETATGVTVGEGEIAPTQSTNSGAIRENVISNTEVDETDSGVTVRSEVIDRDNNTGVGSFFGSNRRTRPSNQQNETIVGRLCTAQPWQTSFVSSIFSSRFFDSMCENRGYVPGGEDQTIEEDEQPIQESTFIDERLGRAQLTCPSSVILGDRARIEWTCGAAVRSSGVGFDTNGWPTGSTSVDLTDTTTYTLECSQGGTAQCTVNIIGPTLQIVAHPQRVPLGARTRLYWVGENVSKCIVSGPGFEENTLRGAATTDAILDQTEFTLTCETPGGSVVEAKTIVDVGI